MCFSSFIRFVKMWWLLISSTLEIPWSEYLNQKYKYQSLQNHICLKLPDFVVICLKIKIVQHSHLYNSFLLIIVACIVILLVAILYRDHVGFCVIVTFSSIHKLKWPVETVRIKNNCLLQCMCIISKKNCYMVLMCSCITKKLFKIILNLYTCIQHTSDDGDFEPSLNFTLRFVMLISYVSVVHVTYILEILS
jgi:hypothetical protein